MTPRNHEKTDSDLTRQIRDEAARMFHEKSKRVWWAIGMVFTAMCSITGAGAVVAINDHGTLRENATKIMANDRQIVEMRQTLIRIDDKLDRLLQRR